MCAAILIDRRGWSDVAARLRDGASALRRALEDPLCAVLGVAVLVAFGYAVVLGLSTPQNDFDTIVDHLWRAAVWRENEAVGYPRCDCAPYVNAYPPHGEMGVLATTVLGGADRYVALVQASAFVALAVGVVGVARGLGLSRREALLGALLVATLPVIALQASTAQNDLVVASFLVAAVALLLDTGRGAPWLAGGATALAVGTKVTAVFGIPILLVVAFLAASTRRGQRLTGVLVGAAAGAYWYVVNWAEAGSWDAGFPYEDVEPGHRRGGRPRAPLGDPARRATGRGGSRPMALPRRRRGPPRRPRVRVPAPERDRGARRGGGCGPPRRAPRADAGRPPVPRRGVPRALAGGRPRRPRRHRRSRHHALRVERDLVRAARCAARRLRASSSR